MLFSLGAYNICSPDLFTRTCLLLSLSRNPTSFCLSCRSLIKTNSNGVAVSCCSQKPETRLCGGRHHRELCFLAVCVDLVEILISSLVPGSRRRADAIEPSQGVGKTWSQAELGTQADARTHRTEREAAEHSEDMLQREPSSRRLNEGTTSGDDRPVSASDPCLVPEQALQGQETHDLDEADGTAGKGE